MGCATMYGLSAMEHFADPRAADSRPDWVQGKKGKKSAGVQRQYLTLSAGSTPSDRHVPGLRQQHRRPRSSIGNSICPNVPGAPMPSGGRGLSPRTWRSRPRPAAGPGHDRPHGRGRVPFAWFAADEEFGQNHKLRRHLGRTTDRLLHGRAQEHHRHHRQPSTATSDPAIIELIAAQPKRHDWQRRACGIGSKGFRVYDWAVIEAPFPDTSTLSDEISTMANSHTSHRYNPCRRTVRAGPRHRSRWLITEEAFRGRYRKRVWRNNCSGDAPGTATSPWRCSPWLFLPRCAIPPKGIAPGTTGSDRQHNNGRIGEHDGRWTGTSTAGPATIVLVHR